MTICFVACITLHGVNTPHGYAMGAAKAEARSPIISTCTQGAPVTVTPSPTHTLALHDAGGRVFRIAGLADQPAKGVAMAVTQWLADGGTPFALRLAGAKPDRYGEIPALIVDPSRSRVLQSDLLAAGKARLSHRYWPAACFNQLFSIEDKAIKKRLGVWADPRFSMLGASRPDSMRSRLPSYQIVEGRILSTGRTKRRLYLNFGAYWTQDFTVEIGPGGEEALRRAGKNPEDWVDTPVRVRGWISESRGPMISIDSANQIEHISGK